jgi:hypothetical protein
MENSLLIQAQTISEKIVNEDSISIEYERLNDVIITASRPVFVRKGNDLTVNVSSTLLSSVGTANDVIKHIPGVSIKDDIISVFSKGTPLIYINNRKLYDLSELHRLQSSDITTVRLITNPGSKYDAEGRAVLLIKTKRSEEDGWAVQVSEQLTQGNHFGDEENIGLSYNNNGFSLFSSYDRQSYKHDRNPRATYTVYGDTLWKQFIDLPQTYHGQDNYRSQSYFLYSEGGI